MRVLVVANKYLVFCRLLIEGWGLGAVIEMDLEMGVFSMHFDTGGGKKWVI